MIRKLMFYSMFFALFALAPIGLAFVQRVPVQSVVQHAALLISIGGFGLMSGLFWLSRLLPRNAVKIPLSGVLRWHKAIGYSAGILLLIHPVLMVAHRFAVEGARPGDTLFLLLRSPLLLPGILAWVCLLLIVGLALFRKCLPARAWRIQHGVLAVVFILMATWHVAAVGRHSHQLLLVFWFASMVIAIAAYLNMIFKTKKESAHESA